VKRKIYLIIRVAVSLILMGYLIHITDFERLNTALSKANPVYLVIFVIVVNSDRFLMAFKWNLLLMAKKILLPFKFVVGSYYRATFAGMFLPSVGADAVRIVEVSRRSSQTADVVSSVVIERVLGLAAILLVGALSVGLLIRQVGDKNWGTFYQLIVLFGLFIAGFVLSLGRGHLMNIYKRLLDSRIGILKKLGKFMISYQDYSNHKQVLIVFYFLSSIEQFFPAFSTYLISEALSLNIPLIAFVIVVPITIAIVRLPINISFASFGVREGLLVYLLGLLGIPSSEALLVAFSSHILSILALAPLMFYSILAQRMTKKVTVETVDTPLTARSRSDTVEI
jgi:uncharacterized protein (TIRG00374 family)